MGFGFIGNIINAVVDPIVNVVKDVVDPIVNVVEDAGKIAVKIVEDTTKVVVDVSNIPQLIDNPHKYFDQVFYDSFMDIAEPLGIAIGDKELAMKITYWGITSAAIVASLLIAPEVSASVNSMMAIAMEMIADTVVLSSVASSIIYFAMMGVEYVTSSMLISSINTFLLSIPIDAYSHCMEEMNKQYIYLSAIEEKNKRINQNYVSMALDGSMNDWMAGGLYYDAPRAGGVTFNPMGSMNTTVFLGLENKNPNPSLVVSFANPNISQQSFGNLAGNDGFSVLNFVKN
jgi:hypothetical protein